jgi:dTDP-4-amino-4,6-dideoxygalactose transaminase
MHLETNKLIKLMPKSKINTDKHMFYMVLSSETERDQLKYYLLANGIEAMFHYIPLHDSKMGKQFGRYIGRNNTIDIAKRILRLPLHSMLNEEDISQITNKINYYFANEH